TCLITRLEEYQIVNASIEIKYSIRIHVYIQNDVWSYASMVSRDVRVIAERSQAAQELAVVVAVSELGVRVPIKTRGEMDGSGPERRRGGPQREPSECRSCSAQQMT